jgi:transcriptional regulator of aromatic amino acid metabolism
MVFRPRKTNAMIILIDDEQIKQVLDILNRSSLDDNEDANEAYNLLEKMLKDYPSERDWQEGLLPRPTRSMAERLGWLT